MGTHALSCDHRSSLAALPSAPSALVRHPPTGTWEDPPLRPVLKVQPQRRGWSSPVGGWRMSAGGAPPASPSSSPSPWHRPVMVEEVVGLLRPVPPGVIVDATLGGGGHSRALLEALPYVDVLGLDQ